VGLAGLARGLQGPGGEAVREFRRTHESAVQFRFWLQWLCEVQLESVQRYARSRGMGLGLYCDLAVGVNEGGAETWVQPSLYALGMHVGAPPDPLNALGQDWGLPPLEPGAAEGRALPALHRDAARQHAPQRRAAHGPRDGADAPVLDPAPEGGTYVTTRWPTCWACWRWRATATSAW
jgi:hypothetical protein